MDLGITGRTALVLGAGGGLGGAIARELAAEGATVVVSDINADAAATTVGAVKSAGGNAWSLPGWDLENLDLVDDRVAEIEARSGRVEILVNNTGGPPPSPVSGQPVSLWQRHFASMVLSVVAITDRVLPGMIEQRWGRVVTSTSSGVISPIPNLGLSNALRTSLLGWSKTLAGEVAKHDITANIVLPGRIATERIKFLDRAKAEREDRPVTDVTNESLAAIPAGRYGDPREYGQTVAFLASAAAAYITGAVIRVDGGYISSI